MLITKYILTTYSFADFLLAYYARETVWRTKIKSAQEGNQAIADLKHLEFDIRKVQFWVTIGSALWPREAWGLPCKSNWGDSCKFWKKSLKRYQNIILSFADIFLFWGWGRGEGFSKFSFMCQRCQLPKKRFKQQTTKHLKQSWIYLEFWSSWSTGNQQQNWKNRLRWNVYSYQIKLTLQGRSKWNRANNTTGGQWFGLLEQEIQV